MAINVGWLAPEGCWDQHLLSLLLTNHLYPTGLEFKHHPGYPNTDSGICLVVPGRYWCEHYDQINEAIARFSWVLAFRVSDEEDWFDPLKLVHPNIKWWVQYQHRDYGDARYLGVGFPSHFDQLPSSPPVKSVDVFLSAQRTHIRRDLAFEALAGRSNSVVNETAGFTQGFDKAVYRDHMLRCRVAPAPSGIQSPDSFRVYEALESHCVPIADDVSPVYDSAGYWADLFPDAPFPVLTDYDTLPALVDDALANWPANANRIAAWWMRTKRQMAFDLIGDLRGLGAL